MRDTSQRREKIVRSLREKGSVQVLELIERFKVSGVTIRKDLRFLETQGVAKRSYGGAILNENGIFDVEVAIDCKQTLNTQEKSNIGAAAAKLIDANDSIILDSGSTTLQITPHLKSKDNLTVITNGLNIANTLSNQENVNLILLGGTLRRKNLSFFGNYAENSLRDLHVDKLFLGVDGFHMERGITTHFDQEAILNRLMCKNASKVILVFDSSKFGHMCLHKIQDLSGVDTIVTDNKIPPEYHEGLTKLGIELILVDA